MEIKNICICSVEQPFLRGGAEIQLDSLAYELTKRGYTVARITLPFVWLPMRDILLNCVIWRWIDVQRCSIEPVDLVICSKFPTYGVNHSTKVTWLIHQFRQAYDLYGTSHTTFSDSKEDQLVRQSIINFDTKMLSESRAIFTESQRVADRLKKFNGLTGTPLYHPPQHWDQHYNKEYGNYILSVGRLFPLKRVDLLINSLAKLGNKHQAVIVGEGPEREKLESLVARLDLESRVKFVGALWGQELVDLYACARAVYYAPYDEDYGLVVPEAFRSRKPILTTNDSGGVLEFVSDGINGRITEPEPNSLAGGLQMLMENPTECARMGNEGYERVKFITWDYVIENLLGAV
jgi:glycosyltransferase involved in cell wall biosynthesis